MAVVVDGDDEVRPLRTPAAGVMTSSWPSRRNVARAPSTVTSPTCSPRRSRSKRDRFWVARAVITARADSALLRGSKSSRRE